MYCIIFCFDGSVEIYVFSSPLFLFLSINSTWDAAWNIVFGAILVW